MLELKYFTILNAWDFESFKGFVAFNVCKIFCWSREEKVFEKLSFPMGKLKDWFLAILQFISTILFFEKPTLKKVFNNDNNYLNSQTEKKQIAQFGFCSSWLLALSDGGLYHKQTSLLIWRENQWTGFNKIRTSVIEKLRNTYIWQVASG